MSSESNLLEKKPDTSDSGLSFAAQCYYVISVGIFLLGLILLKYQVDISNHRNEFRIKAGNQSEKIAESITRRFENLHAGLKTVANLQSVRQSMQNPQEPTATQDVLELYKLLSSFIDLSELYIVQKQFDPTRYDPLQNDHESPLFEFSRPKQNVGTGDPDVAETVDFYEYLEIKKHLDWFNHNYANYSDNQGFRYPAQISKETITGDNTYYRLSQNDNHARMGMVYSIPFYNARGELAGSIAGIFLSRALQSLLPNKYYAIHNSMHGFAIYGERMTDFPEENREWLQRSESNPSLIYSENITLPLPDDMGTWNLWIGLPDQLFWAQQEVRSTQLFTVLSSLATLVLCLGLVTFIFLNERQRQLSRELQSQLELSVQQRSKELRTSETRSRAILDNAADAIIIFNEKGLIETINPAAEQLFGYSDYDSVGDSVYKVIPELYTEINVIKSRGEPNIELPFQCELKTHTKHAEEIFLELHLNCLKAGDNVLYTGICRDITERKRTESELLQAKEEAERATQAKSDFLANMSHELRTPLNAIIGYSEILREDIVSNEHNGYSRDVDQILSAAQQLLYQVNCILDLSKIEAGKMELILSHFDINALIDSVISTVKPMLSKENNKIHTDYANNIDAMEADKVKIKQIMLNLFSNAIKFTNSGTISVYTRQENQHGIDWVTIEISDTGIGMNNNQLTKIFQMFTQGDSTSTKRYGGTGLGLSISKHFCEMMGGSIKVESKLDQGTTFKVKLPLQVIGPKVDPVQVRFPDEIDKQHSRRVKISRIMIISNSRLSQDLLDRFLSREGFFTDICNTVPQALSIIKHTAPDIIVIDENSLSFNSMVELSQLRNASKVGDIPIILLTKSDSKELIQALGAMDFLHKPLRRSEVLQLVQRFIRDRVNDQHILIVDDYSHNRILLQEILQREGLSVRCAANGIEGLESVKAAKPTLIFLDIMMPEMDGFEFAEKIRATPEWSDIPIISITAAELSKEQLERLNPNVNTILRKDELEPAALLKNMRDVMVSKLRGEINEVPDSKRAGGMK